jgi:hypothetical protein
MNKRAVHESLEYQAPDGAEEIRHYENTIPEFVAKAMDDCYGALFSSVSYLRLAGALSPSTSTYVARTQGTISSIFLFEREGPVLRVLNGTIKVEQGEVARFADYIFESMPGIQKIRFPGVHMDNLRLAYPCQRFFAGEDIVISFSGTAEEYAKKLGKSTQKTLKRHISQLAAAHPTSCFKIVKGNAIDAGLIDCIAGWNRQRMVDKNKVCAYKQADVQRAMALTANGGMVGTIMTENLLRAGTVCCVVGSSFYLLMTGHDSDFNHFSVGTVCNYWTAMECLRLKCKEINFMGGRTPHKYNLLGKSRRYDFLVIYRSRFAWFRNLGDVIVTAARGHATEARYALLDCEHKKGRTAKLVARSLKAWRTFRQKYRGIGENHS